MQTQEHVPDHRAVPKFGASADPFAILARVLEREAEEARRSSDIIAAHIARLTGIAASAGSAMRPGPAHR